MTDEWIKVVVHIYNGILLIDKKNQFQSATVRWMNLEPVIQSEEVRKRKRNMVFKAYIWNLEK